MTRVHVVTPFSRPHHRRVLTSMLRPMGVLWHPVCHDPAHVAAFDADPQDWVLPLLTELPTDWDPPWWKLNYFLEDYGVNDLDIYCFLCDDDGYEPGFFDSLTAGPVGDITLVTMIRGNVRPHPHSHPATPLFARPESLHVGGVGVEQMLCRGHVLRGERLYNVGCGDGDFIVRLASQVNRWRVVYRPDGPVVRFNLFEPGRWLWPRDQVDEATRRVMEEEGLCSWHRPPD
jgi:hypothetical protein